MISLFLSKLVFQTIRMSLPALMCISTQGDQDHTLFPYYFCCFRHPRQVHHIHCSLQKSALFHLFFFVLFCFVFCTSIIPTFDTTSYKWPHFKHYSFKFESCFTWWNLFLYFLFVFNFYLLYSPGHSSTIQERISCGGPTHWSLPGKHVRYRTCCPWPQEALQGNHGDHNVQPPNDAETKCNKELS